MRRSVTGGNGCVDDAALHVRTIRLAHSGILLAAGGRCRMGLFDGDSASMPGSNQMLQTHSPIGIVRASLLVLRYHVDWPALIHPA